MPQRNDKRKKDQIQIPKPNSLQLVAPQLPVKALSKAFEVVALLQGGLIMPLTCHIITLHFAVS